MSQPQSFDSTPGAELTAALVEKVTRLRLLYADILHTIAELDREHVAPRAGYSSLPAYITEATHLSKPQSARMVAQAAQITETSGRRIGWIRSRSWCATSCTIPASKRAEPHPRILDSRPGAWHPAFSLCSALKCRARLAVKGRGPYSDSSNFRPKGPRSRSDAQRP